MHGYATVQSLCAGAYRQPIGEDFIAFYGSASTSLQRRPSLAMLISGPGATVPAPSPEVPRGSPGTIVRNDSNSVEVTCDGGPDNVFDGYAGVCTSLAALRFEVKLRPYVSAAAASSRA
jgi:hypothetical protein